MAVRVVVVELVVELVAELSSTYCWSAMTPLAIMCNFVHQMLW